MSRFICALAFCLWSGLALAQGCGPTNPNCVVPDRPAGDSTNAAANTRFVQSLLAVPITITSTPTYSLAAGTLAVPLFMPLNSGTQTVPVSNTFDFIRGSNSDGTDISFTVGASGLATGPYFSLTAASGSSASSNVYGGVFHAQNAGPGTVRGAHLGGFGLTGSTGVISAVALQIQPVTTNSGAWGAFASLTSSGVNGLAIAYGIETSGDTYALGVGSSIAPVGYTTAAYRAWMATASSAGARAFQTLNNAGTEIQYIKLTGEVVSSTALIAGTEANGINLTQAALTRNNVAGSMTFAAGTSAGNAIAFQTGGVTRVGIQDANVTLGLNGGNSGTLVFNGSTSGQLTMQVSSTGAHVLWSSNSVPTANSCTGFSLATGSDDITGQVSFTSATTCSITWGTAYSLTPFCTVTPNTAATTVVATPSTSGLSVTFGTAQTAFTYLCWNS